MLFESTKLKRKSVTVPQYWSLFFKISNSSTISVGHKPHNTVSLTRKVYSSNYVFFSYSSYYPKLEENTTVENQ